ncbi:hypothetical protein [Clostridium beijerinckii]|uniref:hypothetical protein n=1 Tax=Clostridium beijerinckii TaxID=1520 RepID=UPI0005A3440E|nr:hypothetical protein [Clostridium beijerinckii]
MEIDLRKNKDFSSKDSVRKNDGFLYSRYYLDIEPKKNIMQEQYISSIATILEKLWTLVYKVVTACDFEEELPRNGGRDINYIV